MRTTTSLPYLVLISWLLLPFCGFAQTDSLPVMLDLSRPALPNPVLDTLAPLVQTPADSLPTLNLHKNIDSPPKDIIVLLLPPNYNRLNNLMVSLFQNPAMTAFNEQHNFLLQYEMPFYASRFYGGTAMFAYDFNVPMLQEKHPGKFNWGTGIYYRSMGYGDRFKRTQFGITHSLSINLKNKAQLRIGLEFFNFYIHPLTEDQVEGNIAPNQGSGTRVRTGQLDGGVLGYGMINFGVWYQKQNYFVGAALNNINTLEGWHFKGDEKERAMPMEAYVHGGYHFKAGPIVITPMLEYYSKNITVQAFRPRLNIQSLKGRLITGIGYGSKTATINAGYRTKFVSFMLEGGISTHTFGPLKGGWVASGNIIVYFKGKKNQPAPTTIIETTTSANP